MSPGRPSDTACCLPGGETERQQCTGAIRAKAAEVPRLDAECLQRAETARRVGIGVASVYRALVDAKKGDDRRQVAAATTDQSPKDAQPVLHTADDL